jgi:hypothetical protein
MEWDYPHCDTEILENQEKSVGGDTLQGVSHE